MNTSGFHTPFCERVGIELFACFRVDYHWRARSDAFFGHYQHSLRREGDAWRIARQKISVLNDYIPTLLDFYLV